jgi:hypothetical protein
VVMVLTKFIRLVLLNATVVNCVMIKEVAIHPNTLPIIFLSRLRKILI